METPVPNASCWVLPAENKGMEKPTKTAAELEALIRVEMEEIAAWPTDLAITVEPEVDTWKVNITNGKLKDDPRLTEMIHLVADHLRSEFNLKN
jgi:hypothetical protein